MNTFTAPHLLLFTFNSLKILVYINSLQPPVRLHAYIPFDSKSVNGYPHIPVTLPVSLNQWMAAQSSLAAFLIGLNCGFSLLEARLHAPQPTPAQPFDKLLTMFCTFPTGSYVSIFLFWALCQKSFYWRGTTCC